MKNRVLLRAMGFVLAGIMTLSMFAGCGSDSSSKDGDASSGNVLRVGMECAYAPFNWTQTGAEVKNGDTAVEIYGGGGYAYGYDVMVAKKLAENLGMELEIHKVEWDSIGISMDSGEYDCIIAGMGRTAERQLSYSFTEPYYYRDNCIVVKIGSDIENITGLSQLAGKNVTATTQLGTGWVPLLNQIPDVKLGANYETTAEVFMALSNGTADVAIIDVPTAESALLTNKDLKLIVLDSDDTFEGDQEMTNVCIATRKDDTELRDKLQKAMDEIGLDRDMMNSMMEEAISVQPAAN
ncbi:MAG: transporter substrate-binding domain-containing protein [Eubacteriales bacterium]